MNRLLWTMTAGITALGCSAEPAGSEFDAPAQASVNGQVLKLDYVSAYPRGAIGHSTKFIDFKVAQDACSFVDQFYEIQVVLTMQDPSVMPLNTIIDLTDPASPVTVYGIVLSGTSPQTLRYEGGVVAQGNVLFTTISPEAEDPTTGKFEASGSLNVAFVNVSPFNEKDSSQPGLNIELHWNGFSVATLGTICPTQ